MKVMMLCDYPYESSEIFGGTSAAAFHLVQSLLQFTDLDITTFTFWNGCREPEFREEHDGRLRIFRFPRREKFQGLINYAPQRRTFRRILKQERPDIAHAQGEGIYASLAVQSGLPNVFTIHGVILRELEMTRHEIGPIRYFLRTRLVRENQRRATNIIAINKYTQDYMAPLSGAKIRIINNAVSQEYFELKNREEPEIGRILQVGGLRRRKDIVTGLRAVAGVLAAGVSVKLSITGPSQGEYADEVRLALAELGLKDKVTIHGLVSIEELHEIYRRADVFLLSSVEESSPISIVEAMSAGKPIISTNVGGIAETVADGRNGILVASGDHDGLAQALGRVVADRSLRDSMGKESHRLALENWSAEAVALNTHEFYREIAADR